MWNNLLKLTLVTYIWKRYRRTIIGLPLLLLYFWMVNLIHHDIIAYATLNEDTSWLGWTFLFKWLFVFLGVAVFLYILVSAKTEDEDLVEDIVLNKQKTKINKSENEVDDAFARIRKKEKLRSKADIVLEKKK